MLEGQLARIYRELWSLTDDAKPPCWVLYVRYLRMPNGERALFSTHLDTDEVTDRPQPRIWIGRETVGDQCTEPDVANATVEELIALAHERGHECSFRAGTYEIQTMPEERRAWAHADALLRERGFDEWDAFRDAMEVSMRIHRQRGTPEG